MTGDELKSDSADADTHLKKRSPSPTLSGPITKRLKVIKICFVGN